MAFQAAFGWVQSLSYLFETGFSSQKHPPWAAECFSGACLQGPSGLLTKFHAILFPFASASLPHFDNSQGAGGVTLWPQGLHNALSILPCQHGICSIFHLGNRAEEGIFIGLYVYRTHVAPLQMLDFPTYLRILKLPMFLCFPLKIPSPFLGSKELIGNKPNCYSFNSLKPCHLWQLHDCLCTFSLSPYNLFSAL